MGLRGVIQTTTDPLLRLAEQVKEIKEAFAKLRSEVRRDCLKLRGYEVQYRTAPTPGVYLVNLVDGDPNYGVATFIGV